MIISLSYTFLFLLTIPFTIIYIIIIIRIHILIICSEKVLEISKYRVKLDVLKRENDENEKRLKETQIEFNEASTQIAKLESVNNNKNFNQTL